MQEHLETMWLLGGRTVGVAWGIVLSVFSPDGLKGKALDWLRWFSQYKFPNESGHQALLEISRKPLERSFELKIHAQGLEHKHLHLRKLF
jgi:hypothetical protein